MPGLFNARNLSMAFLSTVLPADEPDLDDPFSSAALPDFSACQGVKRRQEILVHKESIVVLSDFGHHPTAIEGTLESLRARWPERRSSPVPSRGNTAVTSVFQDRFADALSSQTGPARGRPSCENTVRIDPLAMIKRIEEGKQDRPLDKTANLPIFETQLDGRPTLVVFFNGSFDGVIDRFAKFAS